MQIPVGKVNHPLLPFGAVRSFLMFGDSFVITCAPQHVAHGTLGAVPGAWKPGMAASTG